MKTASGDPALDGLAAILLRDSCGCAECRDFGSGQRLGSITDLPADVSVLETRAAGDSLVVIFGPDGHRAVFSRAWLAEQRSTPQDDRAEDAKRLWTAGEAATGFGDQSWACYLADDGCRERCLAALLRDGFFLLRDVPCRPGTVLAVAGSMGYVRETNYGRLFDVRVEATPANLAFTGLPIAPHTDNPYRDPVPTVQLLHCLATAVNGGDSGLVDGFMAAALLRAENPAAFEILARTPVTFAYSDATGRAAGDPAHDRRGPARPDPRGQVQPPVDAAAAPGAGGIRGADGRVLRGLPRVRGDGHQAGPDADLPALPGRLRDLRQHQDPARADRIRRDRGAAPAGLLRRPRRGRLGAGGAPARPEEPRDDRGRRGDA